MEQGPVTLQEELSGSEVVSSSNEVPPGQGIRALNVNCQNANASCAPSIVLRTLHILSLLIHKSQLGYGCYKYAHFVDEEIETREIEPLVSGHTACK